MHRSTLLLVLAAACLLAGCDLNQITLLQNNDGNNGLLPADVQDLDGVEDGPELDGGVYLGEVGPSDIGAGETSGVTFTFEGNGGRVCIIVDPQSVWRDDVTSPFMADYPHDDGDLDLLGGLASFYTGTPGVEMGDFFGSFPDSNGVDRAIDLNLCLQEDTHGQTGGTAGRATPEWCDFDTQEGTTYMGVLHVFSVPVDDNELRFAVDIRSGACPGEVDECTLRGDVDYDPDLILPGDFDTVEALYCDSYE